MWPPTCSLGPTVSDMGLPLALLCAGPRPVTQEMYGEDEFRDSGAAMHDEVDLLSGEGLEEGL